MKNVEHIEYYSGGEISIKCNYINGKLEGECIDYRESGEISIKCNYINGKLEGECISYYKSGEVEYKYYYINDNCVTELEWVCYTRNLKLGLLGL